MAVKQVLVANQWWIQEQRGANPKSGANPLFDHFASKNYMKMKKFWPRERTSPHLDPPMKTYHVGYTRTCRPC